MPEKPDHRDAFIAAHPWTDDIEDDCLFEEVAEAIVARARAVRRGALDDDAEECAKAMRSGDRTLKQIEDGRVTGEAACKKAAVALRKFATAAECARPTARRKKKAKRKKAG